MSEKHGMTKIMATGSRFEVLSCKSFDKYDIVQIWPEMIHTNDAGYPVFLCEVMNKESEDCRNGN